MDIRHLIVNRDIFWEVQKIIKNNKRLHKPSSFYKYLGETYVACATMGIRRQVKIDQQSISFARLLKELSKSPQLLSRSYYKGLYENVYNNPWIVSQADKHFDVLAGVGAEHISEDFVNKDLAKLLSTVKKVEAYADKRVAHHDKRKPKVIPKFTELDTAINVLDELYVKYHLLFHAVQMTTLMPKYQYDWKEIFYEPWLHMADK